MPGLHHIRVVDRIKMVDDTGSVQNVTPRVKELG